MKQFVWITFILLASQAQGAPFQTSRPGSSTTRIVQKVVLGGQEICADKSATAGSVDEYVRLHTVRILENGHHLCSGTVIRKDLVLTAVHCFDSESKLDPFTVSVYDSNQKTYKSVKVKAIKFSTSQAYDDLALLKLEKALPESAVASLAKRACDEPIFFQAGFGLTEMSEAARCVRHAEYKSMNPKQINGLTTPLAVDGTFLGVPQDDRMPRASIGCNGDSGGPVYCKVAGKWSLFGVFTAAIPKSEDDQEWQKVRSKCERDLDDPERLKNCMRSCQLSYGIVGFRVDKTQPQIENLIRLIDFDLSPNVR